MNVRKMISFESLLEQSKKVFCIIDLIKKFKNFLSSSTYSCSFFDNFISSKSRLSSYFDEFTCAKGEIENILVNQVTRRPIYPGMNEILSVPNHPLSEKF